MAKASQSRRRWFYVFPLALLLGYLLLPLTSESWEIEEEEIDAKLDYLAAERSLARRSAITRPRPRVILIVADDLALVDISRYTGIAGAPNTPTPSIDRIGEEGATFTEAHATATVCAPSRAALLTGRYQQRFGFEVQPHTRYARSRLEYLVFRYLINTDPMRPMAPAAVPDAPAIAAQGLPHSQITLAELLSARGYATAAFGKWHLGYEREFSPLEFGFDEHYGFYEAFSLYGDRDDPTIVSTPIDDFSDRHMWRRGRDGASALVHNDSEVQDSDYLTFRLAELAEEYIDEHADEPFFLYLPFSAPHTPLQAPRDYWERFPEISDPVVRTYTAMIAALDDAVGRVLTAVDNAGIADDTIIVFTSDNGGTSYLGVTDNGTLAGGKFTTYQGGAAVPLLVRYPAKISPETVCAEPVSLLDVFATVDAATSDSGTAGTGRPPELALDGVDLVRLTSEDAPVTTTPPARGALFWRSFYNKAVRLGEWKLIVTEPGSPDIRPGEAARHELYNLATDPGERHNVSDERPEIVEDLLRRLQTWESELAEPAWPPVMHFRHDIWGRKRWFAI